MRLGLLSREGGEKTPRTTTRTFLCGGAANQRARLPAPQDRAAHSFAGDLGRPVTFSPLLHIL